MRAKIGRIHLQPRWVTSRRCGLLPYYFGHLYRYAPVCFLGCPRCSTWPSYFRSLNLPLFTYLLKVESDGRELDCERTAGGERETETQGLRDSDVEAPDDGTASSTRRSQAPVETSRQRRRTVHGLHRQLSTVADLHVGMLSMLG